jgi:hypothetical protein
LNAEILRIHQLDDPRHDGLEFLTKARRRVGSRPLDNALDFGALIHAERRWARRNR